MGLDLVELVIEVEETFALKIADEDAQRIATVADLIRYVRGRVRGRTGAVCRTSRTFYQFRRALIQSVPVFRQDVRLDRPLLELIPKPERRRVWKQLAVQRKFSESL
jgi:hypothetical protein